MAIIALSNSFSDLATSRPGLEPDDPLADAEEAEVDWEVEDADALEVEDASFASNDTAAAAEPVGVVAPAFVEVGLSVGVYTVDRGMDETFMGRLTFTAPIQLGRLNHHQYP